MSATGTKLTSPIRSFEGAKRVISAGADEVYCAVRIPGIKHLLLNRPSWCTIQTYGELGRVVRYAHDRGVKVIVTMELPFMAEVVGKNIRGHVSSCVNEDIDALIAGDIGILLAAKDLGLGLPLYASTFMACMNYEAVDFLRRVGVSRVILERAVTLDEMSEIVKRSNGVEIEVFVHGAGCSNIEGNCYFLHSETSNVMSAMKGLWGGLCVIPFKVSESDERRALHKGDNQIRRPTSRVPILDAYHFCSICQLPELIKTGVAALKIVGRCLSLVYQEKTTGMYRELIDLIEGGQMESFEERLEEFKREVRYEILPGGLAVPVHLPCDQKRCFYSDLFFAPYKLPKQ